MKEETRTVTGLFKTREETLAAIEAVRKNGWQVTEVNSPVPDAEMAQALEKKKSRVGWFTLAGGVTGFFSGFGIAAFTASRWGLIVSGKPILSWIPFFIIAFEVTILFAVFGNVVGLLTQVGLPAEGYDTNYYEACSSDGYGVHVAAKPEETEQVKGLLLSAGAVK